MKTLVHEEPGFSANLWVNAHWCSAPMLTKGMMEQAWAIMEKLVPDVEEVKDKACAYCFSHFGRHNGICKACGKNWNNK